MSPVRIPVRAVLTALFVAWWSLTLIGAVGNGNGSLVVLLAMVPVALVAERYGRRRARTQPAVVPVEQPKGGE